jgi:hypothetical protein
MCAYIYIYIYIYMCVCVCVCVCVCLYLRFHPATFINMYRVPLKSVNSHLSQLKNKSIPPKICEKFSVNCILLTDLIDC